MENGTKEIHDVLLCWFFWYICSGSSTRFVARTVMSDQKDLEMAPKYLSSFETAEHLRVSMSWLAKSRLSGDGPPFIKAGRTVLYDVADIEAWAQKLKRKSTSQTGCFG